MNLEKNIANTIKKTFLTILFFLIFIFLLCVFISGTKEKKQLHEKIMIKGLGIDYENKEYNLIIQALDFKNSVGEKEPNVKKFELKGKNISDNVSKITKITGLKPLFSQNLIILVGENAAKYGVSKFIDFFTRFYENRLNVKIRIAKDNASKIFSIKSNNKPITAENLKSLVDEKSDIDVLNFERNRIDKLSDPIAFVLEEKKEDSYDSKDGQNESGNTQDDNKIPEQNNDSKSEDKKNDDKEDKNIICERIALFSNDKLIYILNKDETIALQILRGISNLGTIPVDNKNKDVCEIQNVNTKIIPSVKKKLPYFDINIKIYISVSEINDKRNNINKLKEELKTKFINKISVNLDETLKKILKLNCDPLKLGKLLRNKKPNYFKTIENKWKNLLPIVEYKINLEVDLTFIGTGI